MPTTCHRSVQITLPLEEAIFRQSRQRILDRAMRQWIEDIFNHFWFCCQSCNRDVEELKVSNNVTTFKIIQRWWHVDFFVFIESISRTTGSHNGSDLDVHAWLCNYVNRVRTLFWTKASRTFQGLSRTHFPFFKDSIQCKKEPWVYVFFSSTTTWAILSWRSFTLGTWESGLDKVSTEIQGLSSTDCNFQGL